MMIAELLSGTLVKDQYLIRKVLGQGGFGRTYLAYDNRACSQPCVLKEFVPSSNNTHIVRKSRELFEREAKVLSDLDHAQIPRFLAWFEDNRRLFLVQEYVDGKTYSELLEERSQQGQVFSEKEITQWLRDLLPVLEYIHTRPQPIIHRDISPDNIMLPEGQSQPKLIDFGGVKQVMTQLQVNRSSGASYSSQPTVVTKEGYSAPELRTGECFPSSDLYALAVTAVVLLTGKPPRDLFDSYSLGWRWRAYTNVSDRLARVLDKMLAEKPRDRYPSANEVLKDLNWTRTELSLPLHAATPTSTSLPSSTRTPLLTSIPWKKIAIGSFAVLLLGGITVSGSPYIKPICQVLNNCRPDPQEQEFAKRYEQAVKQADSARILAQNPQSIEQLQSVRDRLNNAITQLKQIPPDAEIYPEVQKVLPDYQAQLTEIEAQITKEAQAQEQLEEAEAIAREAAELTDDAQNVPQLEEAKARWQEAVEELNAISSDSLVADRAGVQIQEHSSEVEKIDNRINELIAEEQRRRKEAARLAEEQRRRKEAARPAEEQRQHRAKPPAAEPPAVTGNSGSSPKPVTEPSPSGRKLPCDVALFGECEP